MTAPVNGETPGWVTVIHLDVEMQLSEVAKAAGNERIRVIEVPEIVTWDTRADGVKVPVSASDRCIRMMRVHYALDVLGYGILYTTVLWDSIGPHTLLTVQARIRGGSYPT